MGGAEALGGAGVLGAGPGVEPGQNPGRCLPQEGDVQRHLYLQDVLTQVGGAPERPRLVLWPSKGPFLPSPGPSLCPPRPWCPPRYSACTTTEACVSGLTTA